MGPYPLVAVSALVIPGGTGNRNLPCFSLAGSVFLLVVRAYEAHINRYCLFSSMGAPAHKLTRMLWVWRGFIHHAECLSCFSTWAAAECSNSLRSPSRSSAVRRVSQTTTKSITALPPNYVSLSKYLIIIENKLHVAEIILWGIVNLLGLCF